jgi:hypothetical protein
VSETQGANQGTHQKALEINLDERKYGTFAEIGAGQEVVRWVFRAGGAAGTIAKSMSAYDMTVSDAIYGKTERYVSRERLQRMLDYEYDLECERLMGARGERTEFFVFADTVKARGFAGGTDCHAWLGVKFQTHPKADPSQILIHVRMLDKDAVLQQEALGIIGINLLHGAFYHREDPDRLIRALKDELATERIEVDMIEFSGVGFETINHRLMSLKLVQHGLSDAAMFGPDGEVLQPSEVLYKKPILVERGSFRPVTHVNLDMMECALEQFRKEPRVQGEEPVVLWEITMRNLLASGEIDHEDFLARAELLSTIGATVLISDYAEYFRLAAYLCRYTPKPIGMVMGVPSLRDLFDPRYYEWLEGGILEGFGRLFRHDLKLFVYPELNRERGELITVQKLKVDEHLTHLYDHLVSNRNIESIDLYSRDFLKIWSRQVLCMIREGDPAWEKMVPEAAAQRIKEKAFFGYRAEPLPGSAPNCDEAA